MCEFFSAVLTRDGRLLFTEEDSHEVIIQRAGLRDDHLPAFSNFVRLEAVPPYFITDAGDEVLPAWFDEVAPEACARLKELACRVYPHYKLYAERVRQTYHETQNMILAADEHRAGEWYGFLEKRAALNRPVIEVRDAISREDLPLKVKQEKVREVARVRDDQVRELEREWADIKEEIKVQRHRLRARIYYEQSRRNEEAKQDYIAALRGIEGYLVRHEQEG